jgi:hypothetical protein
MRTRNLKPGFFTNEDLAACAPEARLLFAGLWLLADREGRLEDRPLRIKAQLFPFDAWDVDRLLSDLAGRGFVIRYEVSGQRFIAIPKFSTHQWPHKSEPESKIPQTPVITGAQQKSYGSRPAFPNAPFLPPFPDKAPDKPATAAEDSVSEPVDDTGSAKAKRTPSRPRPRNELFDALARVTASDPKTSGAHIGRVCKALGAADPPYTPAEVERFAQLMPTEFPWAKGRLTLSFIQAHIGVVRSQPTAQKGRRYDRAEPTKRFDSERDQGKV